ncbi:MAG: LPS export ABC transporter periplasmic protein LptC [Rhodospirillales bacterium]|nr:LPS export ABC transporter periplasmic protein LptC [Rhodospirillales bacterium]
MSAEAGRGVPAGKLRYYRAHAGAAGGSPSRYSGFVGLMRYLLPAMAAALLGLVVGWPLISDGGEGLHIPLAKEAGIDGGLTMINASYQGTDAKNRPYAVRGREALQPESDSPIVHLTGVEADIFTGQAESGMLAVSANEGLYQRDAERLDLAGDVTVRSEAGHEFVTAKALVDLPAGTAKGNEPISGKGPHGLLDAGSFALLDRGQVMTFGGRVRVTLFPHAVGGLDGSSGERGDESRG